MKELKQVYSYDVIINQNKNEGKSAFGNDRIDCINLAL